MRLWRAGTMFAVAVLVVTGTLGWAWAQQPAAPQAAPVAVAVTVPVVYLDEIRVELNGKAQRAGNVAMELTVHGRDPRLVSVDVIPKMGADDIAEDLYKELTLAAGPDFKVKCSGQRVTIAKANKKAPSVSLRITNQSILGVSFLLDMN
ncbi:MAG: hypothetical protein MUF10_10445 [Thermoanaerobaculaceae bacterium]|nr:hypothetical protein [Thermoanaerobaculaceae bacterium]